MATPKPDLSVADGASHLLSGGSWSAFGQATTVSYSFRASAPATMPETTQGFQTFNTAQVQAAWLALQSWSDVANISFTQVSGADGGLYSDSGTIRFGDYTSGEAGAAAFTYLPSSLPNRAAGSLQGDGWYNASLSYIADPVVSAYGQQVLVHEIGHALGLDHPSDYNASGAGAAPITYAANASFVEDSRQYTVMSYFSEVNTGAFYAGKYAAAPQLLDIAAAQALYGPNMNAFTGDTVYGFNSNAGRPWFAASAGSAPVFTVWDAGGSDTFDFSGYARAQTVDLNPGHFSDVGGLTGNVAIAIGTTIENAVGGSGADTIIANGAGDAVRGLDGSDSILGGAGADNLNGNKGDDILHGGAGHDTLFGGQGADTIQADSGQDSINGNMGEDLVLGGSGASTVYGGQGADTLHGGLGVDQISGDLGNDILFGGAGGDRFLFSSGRGFDWIGDFNSTEDDRIVLPTGTAYTVVTIQGQAVIDLGHGDEIGLAGVAPDAMGNWLVYA